MDVTLPDVEHVEQLSQASALLDPLRMKILTEARQPASAAVIADRLGLPRQRVNYHVRRLADAGLLIRAGRVKKRNMVEQRYVATSRAYVLDPALLGPLAAEVAAVRDAASVARLVALTSEVQHDLARVTSRARAEGKRIASMSVATEIRFRGPEQRARFAAALSAAVADVIGRHSDPMVGDGGGPAPGRAFRLVVGCYPTPPDPETAS